MKLDEFMKLMEEEGSAFYCDMDGNVHEISDLNIHKESSRYGGEYYMRLGGSDGSCDERNMPISEMSATEKGAVVLHYEYLIRKNEKEIEENNIKRDALAKKHEEFSAKLKKAQKEKEKDERGY